MVYNNFTFGEIANFHYGKMPNKKKISDNGNYPIYSGYRITGYYDEYNLEKDELVIVARGVGGTGDVKLSPSRCYLTNLSIAVEMSEKFALKKYLYYYFAIRNLRYLDSGSAQSQITISDLEKVIIPLPNIEIQRKIVTILSVIDDKIELNTAINENLEQQAQAIFKAWFVDFPNDERIICRADEYFDISIGKTPPRKEHQWFTERSEDIVWVSISDMGNCGMFIEDSSEYLTKEAIEKFNIKIVPENTVLLSFKLTVGRVAIASIPLTTNEAIAHFKTKNTDINEYLYCYLRQFNFQSLGSTSSIATAVNSKIIKSMPFVVPTDKEMSEFHALVSPMFTEILKNQHEIQRLSALRDTLLPKLMNGEIDVSAVRI